jgi:hypothetical protein
MLPLNNPWKALKKTRGQNVVDRPNPSIASDNPNGPKSRMGLRPSKSESQPHANTVKVSERKNVDSLSTDQPNEELLTGRCLLTTIPA